MAMTDYSLSDIAAITDGGGNGRNGWGDGGWWILLLFILLGGNRGWGNNNGGGYGAGSVGGNELYPWMELQGNINNGFAAVQNSLCNGFSNAETSANARQIANMQGMNALQAQLAQCCCDNRLGLANLGADIAREACADRAAVSDGVRDILANQTANTQRILDQMCQDKIDEKNDEIARLRQEAYMKDLAASQTAQNAFIQQGFANEVDALYNRLNTCPVPTTPVYGRTPIFTCNNGCNQSCGCGMN